MGEIARTERTEAGRGLAVPAHDSDVADALATLRRRMQGELRDDPVSRVLYATDASIYELLPAAVAFPRTEDDLVAIVETARQARLSIVPRGAGTSLSGQTVGRGIVVDLGRHMRGIHGVDLDRREVVVGPGVIRDELNGELARHGLFFAPDTSTSNRCMVGGMIGNNSCGSHSILYGTTRDHVVDLDVVLSDAKTATVGRYDRAAWDALVGRDDVLGRAAGTLRRLIQENGDRIEAVFPKASVVRRNTGYALDDLARSWLGGGEQPASLARFLCGSEGTLALTSRARLRLTPLPTSSLVVAAHFDTIAESLHATVEAVRHGPAAVELMDRRILELSRHNAEQDENRWFLEGDPGAILVVEFYGESRDHVRGRADALVRELRGRDLGYAYPIIEPPRTASVWALRKAGLGVLMGAPGDVKPATIVEDTAVAVEDLPAYIDDFSRIMARHGAECVYYAHASVGELHLRPELNLKDPRDAERAEAIAADVAALVRQYRGSLSGEHGDGRVRSPFIREALGEEAVGWFEQIKRAFDPEGILNPGNIVDPASMRDDWRYHPAYKDRDLPTEFNFRESLGMQRAVERCNGAGVCRRLADAGGTMCPSYMVTLDERESTRGRANLFRRLIQSGESELFSSDELADALELCISCKGCKRDCPATVDMARLKAEFTQGRIDRQGASFRSRLFARSIDLNRIARSIPGGAWMTNFLLGASPASALAKRVMGVHPARTLPPLAARSFHRIARGRLGNQRDPTATVCLFVDEFTNLYEPEIGLAAAELLEAGGYEVLAPRLGPSGRTELSKGFVRDARARIEENLLSLQPLLDRVDAIVGVEPSAVLTLRDEAVDLFDDGPLHELALRVAEKTTLVEHFVAREVSDGRWRGRWTDRTARIHLHGHCHQKAIVGVGGAASALSAPPGFDVVTIPSGCCGMAGSFGYEQEHHELSLAIGELVLFPAVRAVPEEELVAAPGFSCRHQIADGTGRTAIHPVVILRDAVAR